jgi:hypothetical protein
MTCCVAAQSPSRISPSIYITFCIEHLPYSLPHGPALPDFCAPVLLKRDDFLFLFASLGLPSAWVVKCKKCGCTINCCAIDPQIEHSEPEKAEPPPQDTVIVTCSCCWTAYRDSPAEVFKGQPGPSSNCRDRGKPNNPNNNKGGRKKAQCSPPDRGCTYCRGAAEPRRD